MADCKSNVWKFMTRNANEVKCKLCTAKFKYCGTTTNLRNHLMKFHKLEWDSSLEINETAAKKQKFMMEAFVKSSAASPSTSNVSLQVEAESECSVVPETTRVGTQKTSGCNFFQRAVSKEKEIENAILYMIANECLPYNFVESKGFLNLMNLLAPKYKVPGRKTVKTLIMAKYDAISKKYSDIIGNVDNLVLTTDLWTSQYTTQSYLGVTAHYFDQGTKVFVALDIATLPMNERHTGENIAAALQDVLDTWSIPTEKIVCLVTDNAANITKAAKILLGKERHLGCFAHSTNLLVNESISATTSLHETLDEVKSIVRFFKHSTVAADKLKEAKIQAVETRWNSKYYMIERYVRLAPIVANALWECGADAPVPLSGAQVDNLKEVIQVLRPIEEMTRELCSESNITISKIVPMLFCLKQVLETLNVQSPIGQDLKNNFVDNLSNRFGTFLDNDLWVMATVLDPRFKTVNFEKNKSAVKHSTKIIKSAVLSASDNDVLLGSDHEDDDCGVIGGSSLWAVQRKILSDKSAPPNIKRERQVAIDLNEYLQERPNMGINPIEFWDTTERFKTLKPLALKLLQILATSVPSERMFSKAGNVMTDKRSRLKPDTLHKLIFLSSLTVSEFK